MLWVACCMEGSPCTISAQRMRACLAANATAAMFSPRRLRSCSIQRLLGSFRVGARRIAERAAGLAAGGILFWHQAEPGGALAAVFELSGVCDGRHKGRCGEGADAFDLAKALAEGVGTIKASTRCS